jgi:hypothetical protein
MCGFVREIHRCAGAEYPLSWPGSCALLLRFFSFLFFASGRAELHLLTLSPDRVCITAGKHDKDAISRRRSGYD